VSERGGVPALIEEKLDVVQLYINQYVVQSDLSLSVFGEGKVPACRDRVRLFF